MTYTGPQWLLASVLFAVTAPAAAADGDPPVHQLRVVNDTGTVINQLFVDGGRAGGLKAKVKGVFGGGSDDNRDRLEARTLSSGKSIVVALSGERCRYDLRAVLQDGRTYLADDFDVCTSDSWSIASGRRR